MLIQAFNRPSQSASPYQLPLALMAASDASADPLERTAAVGGWFCFGEVPQQCQVHWFYKPLTAAEHPWAFKQGDPQKRIAAIELYGSLLLFMTIISFLGRRGADGSQLPTALMVPIPILTDNQSNALTMLANKAKKWPSAAILMELSLQIHVHQTSLAPAFIHRELNDWSDQLSKGDLTRFNSGLQVQPTEDFIILDELLLDSSSTEA